MKTEDFEILYLYKVYELEYEDSNLNSYDLIDFYDQFIAFMAKYTSFTKNVNEKQSRTIIDGILDYFYGKETDYDSTLSGEIVFGINAFLAIFNECKKTGDNVEPYLQQNTDIQFDIIRKLRSFKEKVCSFEL